MESEAMVESNIKKCKCKFKVPDFSYGEVAYIKKIKKFKFYGKEPRKKDYYKQIFLGKPKLYCPICGFEYPDLEYKEEVTRKKIFKGETIQLQNRGIPSGKIRKILKIARSLTSIITEQYVLSPQKYHHKEYILRKNKLSPLFEIRITKEEDHKDILQNMNSKNSKT